jgi:hypothetical protein
MNYDRNPANQRFTRYSVYDLGTLVFRSLDAQEANDDMSMRKNNRIKFIQNVGSTIGIGFNAMTKLQQEGFGIVTRTEVCDLKGYVIGNQFSDVPSREFSSSDASRYHATNLDHFECTPDMIRSRCSRYYDDIPTPIHPSDPAHCGHPNNPKNFRNSENQMLDAAARDRYETMVDDVNNYNLSLEAYKQCAASNCNYDSAVHCDEYGLPIYHDNYNSQPEMVFPTRQSVNPMNPMNRMYPMNSVSSSPLPTRPPTRRSTVPVDNEPTPVMKNKKQKTTQIQPRDNEDNLATEMAKLAANLTKLSTQPSNLDIEDVYPDIREDIVLDREIKKMENEFVGNSDSDSDRDSGSDSVENYYDKTMKISTRSQEDVDSFNRKAMNKAMREKEREADRKGDERKKNTADLINNIPCDIPENLKEQFIQLVAARDQIHDTIQDQTEVVDKANKNLNEEQFKERCRIQDEKKLKKKLEEQKSILSANKIAFIKMRSKIVKEVMKESNVPFMFNDKYCVLRYMEINELVDLSSNDDVESELSIYNQLYKAIEAREYDFKPSGLGSGSDSDYSPLDDVGDDFIEICSDFMDYLEENFPNIVSEAKIHDELNKEINDDNEIFHKDSSKNNYDSDLDEDKIPNNASRYGTC